jgi:ribosomal protein S18 acetylase RimI-like enzyme
MLENIVLRAAKQSDARAIVEVYIASRRAFVAFAPIRHSDEEVYQWIYEVVIPSGQMLVVEKNTIIVGMMVLVKKQKVGWIEQLYLAPTAVGQGIGSLLIQKAKELLGSPIRLCTFQQNTKAQWFYEKHGFRLVELRDGTANEEQCPDAIYEWSEG